VALDNIDIAKQLKKLQEDLNDLVESQTRSLRSQLDISRQLAESMSNVAASSETAGSSAQITREALEMAAAEAEKMGSSQLTSFSNALKGAADQGNVLKTSLSQNLKLLPGFATFTGIWTGFTTGISGTIDAMQMLGNATLGSLESLGQFALSVISFPFKILSGLINMAGSGGGDNSLRQALEDIRKEFGDLRKSSAAAIIDIARNMKGELANTGLSVWRTFGRLAERLKTIAEYAKNMGNVFANVANQFMENGEVIAAYIKGLHLGEAGQKALATRSYALGQSMTEVSRQIANYSVQLADAFGQSAAQVSQDVGEMMADFEHFGGMAPQILTQVSVYARRLGVDVKGLLGVVDQFDNFEGAARSASQLTQAFGLQLDALELLKAQDPAERTEMIRKSFFAAGRSIESMTRQERALLATQTGLEASSLDLIFSAKNQGLSYDQVKKKSEGARKSQLTQEESLQKIAGAIERIVRSGSMGAGGFFERFFQGFERGIIMSGDFRELMINIRRALMDTYRAGIQVGRVFVQAFPGVRQMLNGLSDLFSRERFRQMTKNLVGIFREFFTSLTSTSGRDSFHTLMERLKGMFWDYFDGSTAAGRGILSGIQTFAKAASVIIAGMIREIAKGLTQGVRFLSDILSGRQSLSGVAAAGGGALGFIAELFEPIMEALKEAWPPLVAALEDLFMEEVWPRARDFLLDHALIIAGVLFGPSLMMSLAGGIMSAAGAAITNGLTKGLMSGISEVAGSGSVKAALSKGMSSMFSGVSSGTAGGIAAAGEAAAAASVSPAANPMATASAVQIGAFIVIGMAAVVLGIWAIAEIMKSRSLSVSQMLTASAVMLAAGGVILELAGVISIVAGVGTMATGTAPAIAAGMAAIGVIATAMGFGLYYMIDSLGDFSTQQLSGALAAMTAGAAFFAAAAGVMAIATLVGVGILATGGAAGLALAAGLVAIGVTTAAMVEGVDAVIKAASSISIPGDFDRRFEVFSAALEAIVTFGGLIAQISESSSHSSLWGWVTGGDSDSQVAVLRQLDQTVQNMGEQMVSLVQTIIDQVSSLNAAPEQFQRAELFGRIMSSLGDMMENLQPPQSLMENEAWLFGTNISQRLTMLGGFITLVSGALGDVLTVVARQFQQIAGSLNVSESAIKGFEAIGSILEILGTFGRNMIVIVNSQYSSLTAQELQDRIPQISAAVTGLVNSIFAGGSGGLISAVSELMQNLVRSLSGISERDANRVSGFAPILTAAFGAIGSIGTTIGELSGLVSGLPAEAQGGALGTMNVIIGRMLYGVRDIAVSILTSIKGLFAGMTRSEVQNLSTGVEAFKGMIEAVVTLPGSLKTLSDTLSEGNDGNYTAMRQRLGTIISLFRDGGNAEPGLPLFFREAANTFNNIPDIQGDPAAKMDQLSKSLASVSQIGGLDFNTIATTIESNAQILQSQAFMRMGENIRAMVSQVNSIAAELGAIETVNINTSLKTLAGRLGLGRNEEVTINNENFNIKVKVDVHIDAVDMERVLIDRPNSRIMSRGGTGG
jgi:hypothetical protein